VGIDYQTPTIYYKYFLTHAQYEQILSKVEELTFKKNKNIEEKNLLKLSVLTYLIFWLFYK